MHLKRFGYLIAHHQDDGIFLVRLTDLISGLIDKQFDPDFGEFFLEFLQAITMLVHEYLDLRWRCQDCRH